MGHLRSRPGLFDSRSRVAAADNRSRASSSALSQDLNHSIGALRKRGHLRHAQSAIPDDSLRVAQSLAESFAGGRANIQDAPALRNLLTAHDLMLRVSGETVGDHHIGGQNKLDAALA